ncbi:type VI secretion system tip protein VgrG [Caldimonas thermodepolymerans]|nr:type VI secretion system Vgr family protein [Caldimonas thermodepolymerans]QPC32347.1 type VI secretion system tip protein VgrG [Caldimonas thermodepolymerans]RDH98247.1 Rhs element Vgr protein [Caldimonas thermodepolymerans]TCP07976.1 Rhs element Vgr protein [Caldimonas thermodepolymerans]UZG48897.1 type VI secretion system tip protein VgrG [Caldimonas thermodepolymerans]
MTHGADATLEAMARASGVAFSAETRLYELEGRAADGLLLEAYSGHEALNEVFEYRLTVLSTDAHLDLAALLGQPLRLRIRLADGRSSHRSGLVTQAVALHSDGGLARYELILRPWLAALDLTWRSQTFLEQDALQIAEHLFRSCQPLASWRLADEVASFIAEAGPRPCCNQFRETDLQFLTRLFAEEGLGWYVEEDPEAPAQHRLVCFADSTRLPRDPTDAADGGLRHHRASSQPARDTIQWLACSEHLHPGLVTVLAWDPQHRRSHTASVPIQAQGPHATRLEHYAPGTGLAVHGAVPHRAVQRHAWLQAQAFEAAACRYQGRSTVRSLRAGRRITVHDAPQAAGEPLELLVTAVTSAGINNLPRELIEAVARRLGPCSLSGELPDAVRREAAVHGHANVFQAIDARRPWRPQPVTRPTVSGPQSALVVGPDGETEGEGIHTDRYGRIRVRFHWQEAGHPGASAHSLWVRVAQPWAGAGMGSQFLPRIGQEVLVDFEERDIDRPIVLGALYNGRGEAGVPPTPGGATATAHTEVLHHSTDHRPSAQGNLCDGGHAPAWHGAAAQAQHNAAALGGIKSCELEGTGANELRFDDSNAQLALRAATTQHASWLQLGHLLHYADNHRGSLRGLGLELRTDAYGAIRGGRGLMLSSYPAQPATPAGDATPAVALARQMVGQAAQFSHAARTHGSVPLAGHEGSDEPGSSRLRDQAAPLEALQQALRGTVDAQDFARACDDADRRHTRAADDKVPHVTDPLVAICARAGLALTAGQDVLLAAGEVLHTAAGRDVHQAVGGQARLHTGQAIGVLAGAVGPGEGAAGTGLTMVAAQGPVECQAQDGPMQLAAHGLVDVRSRHAHIDWAAATRVVLATAGGACITIDAQGITCQCPGKFTVRAARKRFAGPSTVAAELNAWPGPLPLDEEFKLVWPFDETPVVGRRFEITRQDGTTVRGVTDAHGRSGLQRSLLPEGVGLRMLDEV